MDITDQTLEDHVTDDISDTDIPPEFRPNGPELVTTAPLRTEPVEDRSNVIDPELKRGRGRPPGPNSEKFRHFPPPAIKIYQSGKGEKAHKPEAFISYWQRLAADVDFSKRCDVYAYRTFPVVDRQWDKHPDGKPKRNKSIEGPISQPLESLNDCWHRWGSGDYKLIMSDNANGKQICSCWIEGIRDYDTYPPVFDYPEDIVTTDPKNGSYLVWRRQRGLAVPGEASVAIQKEKDDEMAATETVTRLADSNQRLTDRIVDMAESRLEQAQKIQAQGPTIQAAGPVMEAKAFDLYANMATSAVAIVKDAATENRAQNRTQQDPVEMFQRVVTLVKELHPPAPNGGESPVVKMLMDEVAGLRGQLTEMQNLRMAEMEKRLEAQAKAQREAVATSAPIAPKTFREQIQDIAALKKELGSILGDDGDSKPEKATAEGGSEKEEAWYKPFIPMLLPLGMYAMQMLGNAFHNQAVAAMAARTPPGTPPDPATPQPQAPPPPPPLGPTGGVDTQAATQAVMQTAQRAAMSPEQQKAQAAHEAAHMNQARILIGMIEQPLLTHINQGDDGLDFAEWFVRGYGRDNYSMVRAAGKQALVDAIGAYSTRLSAVFSGMKPDEADAFFEGFLSWTPPGPDAE